MDYANDPRVSVGQIAGPGVPGLENDPPVYHIDIDGELMPELLADPMEFVRGLGLGPERGVAPGGELTVKVSDWAWDGSQWIARADAGAGDAGAPTRSCCYMSGDELTCHQHTLPPVG